jgi:hypothetical protein
MPPDIGKTHSPYFAGGAFFGVPGMDAGLAVKVRYRLGSRNC